MSLLRRVQQKTLNLEEHRGGAGICRVGGCERTHARGDYLCLTHQDVMKRLDLSRIKRPHK